MGVQDSGGMQQFGLQQDVFQAGANLANRGDYCTLILDGAGRILSCGAAAENIFGDGQARLLGRRICDFVSGLFLKGSSPSYCARYLVHLCSDGEWREFEAMDVEGRLFPVDLKLAQLRSKGSGSSMFLLSLRRREPSDSQDG